MTKILNKTIRKIDSHYFCNASNKTNIFPPTITNLVLSHCASLQKCRDHHGKFFGRWHAHIALFWEVDSWKGLMVTCRTRSNHFVGEHLVLFLYGIYIFSDVIECLRAACDRNHTRNSKDTALC